MTSELVPRRLAQTLPSTTAEATIYTPPTGSKTIVKQIILANVGGSQALASVSVVPSGGVAGNSNRIIKDVAVPANAVMLFDLSQVLHDGDFLSVKVSSGNTVVFTVSGVEYLPLSVSGGGGGGGPHVHELNDLPSELMTEAEVAANYAPIGSGGGGVGGGETDPIVFMGGL